MRIASVTDIATDTQPHEANEQLRLAVEAIDEAIFRMGAVRDGAGRIVDFVYHFCNRAALMLLGRGSEEVFGRRLLELFPSHRTNGLFDAYVRVIETDTPLRLEFEFDEGGVSGDFEIVVSRTGDGFVVAGHEISERKRVERDLVALTAQLENALTSRVAIEQAKGFVAAASGTDPDTAFHSIRHYARSNNLKIRDVCQGVVAGKHPDLIDTLSQNTG